MGQPEPEPFEKIASDQNDISLTAELWSFLRDNKKWWLLPILIVLLGFALLLLLSTSAAAPFIYTLF